jgi:hypothetical protein
MKFSSAIPVPASHGFTFDKQFLSFHSSALDNILRRLPEAWLLPKYQALKHKEKQIHFALRSHREISQWTQTF